MLRTMDGEHAGADHDDDDELCESCPAFGTSKSNQPC